MKRLLVLVVILILYGSLFPWRLVPRHLNGGPVWYLLHRWDTVTNSYLVHDVAVNIALYLPLGLAAHFVFEGSFAPLLLAAGLSLAVELTQIYIPFRQATMVDVLANIAGAALGASIAVLLRALPALPTGAKIPRVHRAAAWLWLLAMGGWLSVTTIRHGFEWLPFELLLRGNPQTGLIALAVRAVSYVSAIALFRLSGLSSAKATALVAAAAALAARTGVTEPLIAVLCGVILITLFPETETQSQSAG